MSKLLNNLIEDERRQMFNSHNQPQPIIHATQFTSSQHNNSHAGTKYDRLMDAQAGGALRENIGIMFNDDSLAQVEAGGINGLISHAAGNGLDTIKKYLVISSADRDWYNKPLNLQDENPYKFRVQLGGINTRQIDNTHQATDIVVNNALDNVMHIECTSIVIPNRQFSNGYRASFRPYILVSVDKASDTAQGSNKALDSALAILVPKLPTPQTLSDIRYLEHVNINKMGKNYLTPEARINRLAVTISRQDGFSPVDDSASVDIVNIESIYYESGFNYLFIRTSGYFNQEDYLIGDIIKIKGYVFRDTNLGYSECNYFNQFVNRESGHIIQLIGQQAPYTGPMYNVIAVYCPGSFSQSVGDFAVPSWFTDFIAKTNIEDQNTSDPIGGKALNLNLQTQVFVTATCYFKSPIKALRNIKPAT